MKTFLIIFKDYSTKVIQLNDEWDIDRHLEEIPLIILELTDELIEEISKLRG